MLKQKRLQKIIVFMIGVSLLAVGCSKKKEQAPVTSTTKIGENGSKVVVSTNIPSGWVNFVSGDNVNFDIAMPKTWVVDDVSQENHFIIRSSAGATGAKAGDSLMIFNVNKLSAKSLAEQVVADTKDGKNVSTATYGKTNTGLEYAFVRYTDTASTVKSWSAYAVATGLGSYVSIKTATNGGDEVASQIVKTVRVWKR